MKQPKVLEQISKSFYTLHWWRYVYCRRRGSGSTALHRRGASSAAGARARAAKGRSASIVLGSLLEGQPFGLFSLRTIAEISNLCPRIILVCSPLMDCNMHNLVSQNKAIYRLKDFRFTDF